jgi:hypothetical protein
MRDETTHDTHSATHEGRHKKEPGTEKRAFANQAARSHAVIQIFLTFGRCLHFRYMYAWH